MIKSERLKRYINGDFEPIQEQEEDKSLLKTVSAGLQYLGQGALKGLEGVFVDTPLVLAAGANKLFGNDEGADALMEASRISATNALINSVSGNETNPYINNNQNLWNKEVDKNSYIKEGNLGGKILQATGEMLPTIAIGGGITGNQQLAGNILLGSKAFSSGANEAYEYSGNILKAYLYGLGSAGTEILTEKISGGIPGLKQIPGDTTEQLAKNYIKNMLGEAVEEGVSTAINPLLQTTYMGKDALNQYNTDLLKDIGESMLIGGVVGGVLDAPNVSRNIRYNNNIKSQQSSTPTENKQLPTKQTTTQPKDVVNVKSVPTKTTEITSDGKINNIKTQNNKITDENGEAIIFNRFHPDYANISDDFDYNQSNVSHETGFGYSFMDNDTYTKGKDSKDVLSSTITTKNGLLTDSNNIVSTEDINKLNAVFNEYIPGEVMFGENITEAELIDSINKASNFIANLNDNNTGRKAYTEFYKAINKDGYMKTNSDGSRLLSVVSKNSIDSLNNTDTKQPTINNQTKKKLPTKNVTAQVAKETKKTTTSSELDNQFKSIEDSYSKANKYTGEIKQYLLKTVQKEYNKYRDNGGNKTIASLEENYQAEQKIAKALNKTTETTTYTSDQANTRRKSSESMIKQYQRNIDRISSKNGKLDELRKIVSRYNEDIAKGMEPIEQYEKWKSEVEIHESATKAVNTESAEEFKEAKKEFDSQVKTVNKESFTGDAVLDEVMGIGDTDLDDIEASDIDLEPTVKNSTVNTEYNQQQKQLAKKTTSEEIDTSLETALANKEAATKKYTEHGGTYILQQFADQFASLRNIDKQNGNDNIISAIYQRNKISSLIYQVINGNNLVDINYNPTDIPSVERALRPIEDLPTDMKAIAQEYILLQMDYFNKVNNDLYDMSNENNIFPKYTTEDIENRVSEIEGTYGDLSNLVKNNVMPNIRKIVYKLNRMEIETNTMRATMEVSEDFARNEMGMSDDEIKAHTKKGKIKVDTADFFMAANPWYIPISREIVKTYGSEVTSKVEAMIAKPKGRVEGAEQYSIQNLADGMAEKVAAAYYNMKSNQARQAIADGWSNITENKVTTYTDKEGKLQQITTAGDGTVQMSYLANDVNGNLVTKSVNITKNMADAYNGIDSRIKAFRETKVGKALSFTAKIRKNLLTKYNLPWQVKNLSMDTFDALLNNEFNLKGNIKFLKNELGAFMRDAAKNTETYQEFMAYRGKYFTETEQKGYIRNETSTQKTLNKIDSMLELGELTTRYALYKTARDSGMSIAEAQLASDTGTTDFNKTGSIFKMLDSVGVSVFLSANVAGLNRFVDTTMSSYTDIRDAVKTINSQIKQGGVKQALNKQSYTDLDAKLIQRSATKLIKISVIFGLGRELLKELFDDEESQKQIDGLSDTEIQNNIVIPTKNGVIKIPKGRIWRAYDAIADIVSDNAIRDEDKMDVIETIGYVWDSVGVGGIDDSTTLSTFNSILKNEDYYGNEIYKDSAISKETLDYLLGQYGSVYYKTFKYVNGGTDKNPWLSTFYTDTSSISSYNTRFYNMKDAYSTTYDKSVGTFKNNTEMQNYFAYRVINYEKSSGELSVELAKLKAMKADSTTTATEIRKQEARVQALYQDIFEYIDNNKAVDYSTTQDGSIIKYGTNYRFTKNSEGSYVKSRK